MNRFKGRILILIFSFMLCGPAFITEVHAQAAGTITVPEGRTLVLGDAGKYIFTDDGEVAAAIPQSKWDTPDGVFDAQTTVVTGQSAFVRSVAPVKIARITGGDESTLVIVEGSRITVEATDDTGIYIGWLVVGSLEPASATELTVSAAAAGIECVTGIEVRPRAVLDVKGESYGILHDNPMFYYDTTLYAHPDSKVTATATGSDGIAIMGDSIFGEACEITASAPRGKGGIRLKSSFIIMAQDVGGVPTRSVVHASSYEGRAVSVGYGEMYGSLQIIGSILNGVTPFGEVGVYASSISATNSMEPYYLNSEVLGSANIGYGVVGQNLDSDSEFPSGGLNINASKVVGRVNEGIGISSFILSADNYNSNGYRNEIEGIAHKGLGISVCSGHFSETDLVGKSYGSTEKHFQVYNSIADSAGINFLSYITMQNGATVVGEAPMSDPGSFGIHGRLADESEQSGYSTGELHAYAYGSDISIAAKGGVGLSAYRGLSVSADEGAKLHISAHGSVNGIEVSRMYAQSGSAVDTAITIDAVGESGAGLKTVPTKDRDIAFVLNGAALRATGGRYGADIKLSEISLIQNSRLEAAATQQGSTTGLYMEYVPYDESWAEEIAGLTLTDSVINASGGRHGWHSKNINVEIVKDAPLFHTNDMLTAKGGEVGMLVEIDGDIEPDVVTGLSLTNASGLGNARITAVSDSTPPDLNGRSPAVSAPAIKITGAATLLEDYLTPVSVPLSQAPYMAYARNQNLASLSNYSWEESAIPVKATADGLSTDTTEAYGAAIIGKRSEPLPDEPIDVDMGGAHQVRMINGTKTAPVPQAGDNTLRRLDGVRNPPENEYVVINDMEIPEMQVPLAPNPSTGAASDYTAIFAVILLLLAISVAVKRFRKN